MTYQILQGDVLEQLRSLPEHSVHTCVTSPPYWGLRDYGVDGQLGLEKTPQEYVAKMVEVFRGVKRVLRDDGTLWLNLGDSYANDGKLGGSTGGKHASGLHGDSGIGRTKKTTGLKSKDLVGIPWRVAFALQEPYTVPDCIKSGTDRAWLAAMFDGEGCIGIRRFESYRKEKQQVYQDGFVVYTSITNNDVELIDRCIAITGKGKIGLKQRADKTDGRGIVSRHDSHVWRLDGNDAMEVIRAIYPYLIAKRKQACLANSLDMINKNKRRVEGVVPPEDQDRKQFLYESIKRCNQRRPFDLPSWISAPERVVEPGWYLRSDIIWAKTNPMPESVRDRPTRSHEYLFLLAKSAKYYYDVDAIKEPAIYGNDDRKGRSKPHHKCFTDAKLARINPEKQRGHSRRHAGFNDRWDLMEKEEQCSGMRNKRDVWTVATKPYKEAHFATFPPKLIEPCILAGCPENGNVLDPFCGSGTTGEVSLKQGRNFIGIELNPAYVTLAHNRIGKVCGLFSEAV